MIFDLQLTSFARLHDAMVLRQHDDYAPGQPARAHGLMRGHAGTGSPCQAGAPVPPTARAAEKGIEADDAAPTWFSNHMKHFSGFCQGVDPHWSVNDPGPFLSRIYTGRGEVAVRIIEL